MPGECWAVGGGCCEGTAPLNWLEERRSSGGEERRGEEPGNTMAMVKYISDLISDQQLATSWSQTTIAIVLSNTTETFLIVIGKEDKPTDRYQSF